MREKTLVIIKPDGILRGLMGEVISRLERKGMKIVAAKFTRVTPELAQKHYEEHVGKPFFPSLQEFITSNPVMVLVVEGNHVISTLRTVVGATNGREATPGTIRGDFGSSRSFNIIHASDSLPSAEREIANFFSSEEIFDYELPAQASLFDDDE